MARASRSAKRLVILSIASVALIGVVGWWRADNTRIPEVAIPQTALPTPNAYDSYVAAFQYFIPTSNALECDTDQFARERKTSYFPPSQLPQLQKAIVRANFRALALLRHGFAYDYRQPAQRSFKDAAQRAFWSQCRAMAHLLMLESKLRGDAGDWQGAAHSALDIIHIGYDVPRGAPLPAPMVGWSIREMGSKQLWQILPHLNVAECKESGRKLELLRAREVSWAESLREEKWTVQAGLLEVIRTIGWEKAQLAELPPHEAQLRALCINNRAVLTDYTQLLDAQIAQAKRPYPLQVPIPTPAPSFTDPINTVYAPPLYARSITRALRASTNEVLVLTALALRAYQLEHGCYPSTLLALVPRYLQKMPRDPFDSRIPLHYALQKRDYLKGETWPSPLLLKFNTGLNPLLGSSSSFSVPVSSYGPPVPDWAHLAYILYSIGPDSKDNGGKPVEEKHLNTDDPRRWHVDGDNPGDFIAGLNY